MVAASVCYHLSVIRAAYCADKRQRSGTVYLYNILINLNSAMISVRIKA